MTLESISGFLSVTLSNDNGLGKSGQEKEFLFKKKKAWFLVFK